MYPQYDQDKEARHLPDIRPLPTRVKSAFPPNYCIRPHVEINFLQNKKLPYRFPKSDVICKTASKFCICAPNIDLNTAKMDRQPVNLHGMLLEEGEFEKTFRICRISFETLHGVLPCMCRSYALRTLYCEAGYSLPPYYSISSPYSCILFYVTQGMTYVQISKQTGIDVKSACKYVHECTYAICRHMFSAYIRLPTPMEARANMEKWKQQSGSPGIYGAIDWTHIPIEKPCRDGEDY